MREAFVATDDEVYNHGWIIQSDNYLIDTTSHSGFFINAETGKGAHEGSLYSLQFLSLEMAYGDEFNNVVVLATDGGGHPPWSDGKHQRTTIFCDVNKQPPIPDDVLIIKIIAKVKFTHLQDESDVSFESFEFVLKRGEEQEITGYLAV